MSVINTGTSIRIEGADPRAPALAQIGPRSRNIVLTAITRFEVRDNEFTVWATDMNGLEAPHNGTRVDADTAAYLYGRYFSIVKLSEADHILHVVTTAQNPPPLAILGSFYLKFTANHLASTGSAALTRQQQEWDSLVHVAFDGHLQNNEFNTGFIPVNTSPRFRHSPQPSGGNVTPPFSSQRRRRNKGKKAERAIKWE
ncbi:hypothetical protein JCM1840_007441 [Sporobolomyces johnsonii]